MGETHGFRTGCKRLIHPFEQVHRTAEWVFKFFERLARTSERLTHPFEWVHRTTERVIKFFKQLTRMGERLTYPSERLIKISERVPQTTEQLTLKIILKRPHFTTGRPVSSGMKLLFGSYPQ